MKLLRTMPETQPAMTVLDLPALPVHHPLAELDEWRRAVAKLPAASPYRRGRWTPTTRPRPRTTARTSCLPRGRTCRRRPSTRTPTS